MTAVAKVFKNGRSQAVRLPKEFRVKGPEVYLRHTPEGILITERDPWDAFEEACQKLSDKFLDALEARDKPLPEERESLKRKK
jgi:antitoxin VapB